MLVDTAAVCREVSNILSRGQPPPEPDERHKWTHPSPVTAATSRPLSCPLYPATPRQETIIQLLIDVYSIHILEYWMLMS